MILGRLFAFALAIFAGAASGAEPPARVVSINLCTDQMAVLLAGPGQLVSVSNVAADPLVNPMAEEAKAFPVNYGRAEEIWLLKPDLVLAGEFTPEPTIAMLRRLGIKVLRFPAESTLEDISTNLRMMGEALGREGEAARIIADFESGLAAIARPDGPRPRAALYQANGWSVGDATLSGRILARAGFINIASEFGIDYGGAIPLEALVMAEPDLIVTGARYAGASEAETVPRHPVLSGFHRLEAKDAEWSCGGPHVLRAVKAMEAARERLEQGW